MNNPKSKIKALEKAIWGLKPYVQHAKGCAWCAPYIWGTPDSDFCTCNLKEAVEATQKALAIKT